MSKSKIIATLVFVIMLVLGTLNYSFAAINFPSPVSNDYFISGGKIKLINVSTGKTYTDRFYGISGNSRPTFKVHSGSSHLSVGDHEWENFYCMQHQQSVNKQSQNEGKVFARIQFNKDKMIVSKYDVGSNDSFYKKELNYNITNAYMVQYILTKSNQRITQQKSGDKNLTQRLIWYTDKQIREFLNSLKTEFNKGITDNSKKWDLASFTSDGSAGHLSSEAKPILKKYANEAKAYQTFGTSYDKFLEDHSNKAIVGSTDVGSNGYLKKTTFNSEYAIIGTIKLNYIYGGCNDTNVKFGDILQDKIILKNKKTGTKIPTDKWSICNNKGNSISIKSGTNFYIKVNKQYLIDNIVQNGEAEMEIEVPYKRIFCKADIFFNVNGSGSQLTSVLGGSWLGGDELTYQTSVKLNLKIKTEGQLKIQKKDVTTKTILHNYKVYVKDSNGNYYDKNGKNKGSTITKITIGNDDYITIPLPNGKYTVIEVEAPNGYDLEKQTKARGAVTEVEKTVKTITTATATLKNWKQNPGGGDGNLVIRKTDQDTGKPIEGIIFNVYSSTDPDNKINLNEEGLVTDENGEIKLDIGHFDVKPSESYDAEFTIEEVGSNNLYYAENENEDGHLNKIVKYHHEPELWYYDRYYRYWTYHPGTPDSDPNDGIDDSTSGYWTCGSWYFSYTGSCHSRDDAPASYDAGTIEYKTDNIRKIKDCEISITPDNVEVKDPKAYSITLNKIDNYNNNSLNGAKVVIQYEDDETYLTGSHIDGLAEYSGDPVPITINGTFSITGVKRGTYHIYEVEAPRGYNLELMDNYDEELEAVDLGEINVDDDDKHPQMDLENQKYVKIRGKVWEDGKAGKDDKYDYIGFDTPYSTDVNLVKDGEVVAETSTEEDGSYEFSELDSGDRILYWELQDYTVQFLYDKGNYITVPVKLNEAKGSKAIEMNVTEEELDDNNLVDEEGWATTKPGSNILEVNYNEDTLYVENINFGVMEKNETDHSVSQTLSTVRLEKGGFKFTYNYAGAPYDENKGINPNAVINPEDAGNISSAEMTESSRSYTQKLYPSDIKYNTQDGLNEADEYKVYAVYKIDITNNTTWNEKDRYIEKALYLNSLTSAFNDDYYELSDNNWSIRQAEIENENGQKETVNEQGVAIYNKISDLGGIEPGATKTTYIQFRVKEEALENLLNPTLEDMIECVTNVYTDGYHQYDRDDSNWADNTQGRYTHKTINETAEDIGLGLKLTLSSTRKVQGSVFEDTKDESEREDERIGDGIYSEDENNLTDVIVSMHNANDNSFAQLYDTLEQVDEHTWKVKKKNAVQKVNEDGTYEFVGLVPGNYYLKFTYGNGDVSYTDMEGNTISHIDTKIDGETINSNLYKSTILTGPAKGEDDKYSGEYWYIGNIEADRDYKKYSIATDITIGGKNLNEARLKDGNINEILNNKTQHTNDGIIEARSPNMNINFEYLKEDEIEHSEDVAKTENGSVDENGKKYKLLTNCKGMYFGIIERPYIDVELKKNIKNIKLTLQNGTTIINQDPTSQNVSPYITNLDTHQDEDTDKEESGYAKLEMDSQNLFSSAIEITYLVKVTNKSEVDYSTVDYYTKGYIDESKDVKTRAAKIIDYIPKDCNYETNKSKENTDEEHKFELKNLTKADIETLYNSGDGYFTEDAYKEAVKDDYKKLEVTSEKELKTWKLNDSEIDDDNTLEYEITVSKLLNNNEEDLGLTSYTELIAVSNIPKTPQRELTSGSYVIGDEDTHEADDDSATLIITPSTGENRDYTVYIIAGAMLIAAIGIGISIKRHLR